MYHGQQPPSFPPPSSPSRPKKDQQKDYRDEERACIDTLREILKEFTGVEHKKRHEVLTAAINVLLTIRGSEQLLKAVEIGGPPEFIPANGGSMAPHAIGYHTPPHSSSGWQPNLGPDAAAYYGGAYQQHPSSSQGAGGSSGHPSTYYGSQGASQDWHRYSQH